MLSCQGGHLRQALWMQGNIPALLIPGLAGSTQAAEAAAAYTVTEDEAFILRATAGIYPGELTKLFDSQDLSTNPIGTAFVCT